MFEVTTSLLCGLILADRQCLVLSLFLVFLMGHAVVVDMKIGKPCVVLKSYCNFEWLALVLNKTFFAIAKQIFKLFSTCTKI